jgi:hypothetical protein
VWPPSGPAPLTVSVGFWLPDWVPPIRFEELERNTATYRKLGPEPDRDTWRPWVVFQTDGDGVWRLRRF